MKTLHSKMTTQELANCVGMAKQTINRWVREQGWVTERIPGVKGGRARLIHIDQTVRDYLTNTPALRHLSLSLQQTEPLPHYSNTPQEQIWLKIVDTLSMMTDDEKQRMHALLVREGLSGMMARLSIADNVEAE